MRKNYLWEILYQLLPEGMATRTAILLLCESEKSADFALRKLVHLKYLASSTITIKADPKR